VTIGIVMCFMNDAFNVN